MKERHALCDEENRSRSASLRVVFELNDSNDKGKHINKTKVEVILSFALIFLLFFALGFFLLFGSFSSFGGNSLIPEKYFMYYVIGAIIVFSIFVFLLTYNVQRQTSNPDSILKTDDYNGSNSLRVMATGATIASLTFTIYAVSEKTLGLGFLRILIVPAIFSSIMSALAFIFRRFRPELLFTSMLLLLQVFIIFIFILPQFF